MKTIITTIALLLTLGSSAQSSQDRVMLQQIAALKTYGNYIKKGYRVAKDGLDFIGRLKDGELNLHALFFEGLENVSPFIRNYPKAAAILELNGKIEKVEAKLTEQLAADDLFYGDEKDYIRRVMTRVLTACADDIEALQDIVSENNIVADDAERIKRIDALHNSMEDRFSFTLAFYNECKALAASRGQELSNVRQVRKLHNLNEAP